MLIQAIQDLRAHIFNIYVQSYMLGKERMAFFEVIVLDARLKRLEAWPEMPPVRFGMSWQLRGSRWCSRRAAISCHLGRFAPFPSGLHAAGHWAEGLGHLFDVIWLQVVMLGASTETRALCGVCDEFEWEDGSAGIPVECVKHHERS